MFSTRPNVAVAILAMLALVLLASPFVLQEENVWCMELCFIKECVEPRDLYSNINDVRTWNFKEKQHTFVPYTSSSSSFVSVKV
jgi:hypothetical protein